MSGTGSLGAPMSKKEEAAPASRLSMTLSGQGTQPPFSVCLHLTSLLSHGSQQVPPPSVCLTLLQYPINMSSNHSVASLPHRKERGLVPVTRWERKRWALWPRASCISRGLCRPCSSCDQHGGEGAMVCTPKAASPCGLPSQAPFVPHPHPRDTDSHLREGLWVHQGPWAFACLSSSATRGVPAAQTVVNSQSSPVRVKDYVSATKGRIQCLSARARAG